MKVTSRLWRHRGRMGARQSIDDRPRSNSVDASSGGGPLVSRGQSRSVVSPADLVQSIRNHHLVDDDSDNETPGPSRSHASSHSSGLPIPRRAHLSGGVGRRSRVPHHSNFSRRSMPIFVVASEDINCPICHKTVASDEADVHLVMCLTRPKITYNEDVLTEAKGECAICFEEMDHGSVIARLPCLCIYHKSCIDDWFKRKNCCPEHPGDD